MESCVEAAAGVLTEVFPVRVATRIPETYSNTAAVHAQCACQHGRARARAAHRRNARKRRSVSRREQLNTFSASALAFS